MIATAASSPRAAAEHPRHPSPRLLSYRRGVEINPDSLAWVADHKSQRRAEDGTGQAVDALERPRLGGAPAKEPAERVPEAVLGHEPVGFVL